MPPLACAPFFDNFVSHQQAEEDVVSETAAMELSSERALIFHCPECVFLTLNYTRLVEHFLSHAQPVECAIYQCGHCDAVCSHLGVLHEHSLALHKNKSVSQLTESMK